MLRSDVLRVISLLLDLCKSDTVYRDLYLKRARKLLESDLSPSKYTQLIQDQKALLRLPEEIRKAMEQGEWERVKETSARLNALRRILEENHLQMELGHMVYESSPPLLDPFSPGLQNLAGVHASALPSLRDKALNVIEELRELDPAWQKFYTQRHQRLEKLLIDNRDDNLSAPIEEARLEEDALDALKQGQFERLEHLAEALEKKNHTHPVSSESLDNAESPVEEKEALFCTFSKETLRKAESLGLFAVRADSWQHEFAGYCRYAWHPPLPGHDEASEDTFHLHKLDLPPGTPDALKSRIELFMMHPFVNSGGGRFIPTLVAEDVLVETFPDPDSEDPGPHSALLSALGLQKRRSLTRLEIEQALQEHGSRIVEEDLSLDPWEFRLVCIPPDIHLRIGEEFTWGQKPLWTHMDGYMVMSDKRLRALAGGDVRFGGLYDLLGLGVNYASEGVIARFAVVQRKRMETW